VTTSIYLKISISDFLTLFSGRTGDKFWWESMPATVLLCAAGLALCSSTILAVGWPGSYPDGIYALGLGRRAPFALPLYIWFYCIFWWQIQDFCKVILYKLMIKYNWFGWNDTGHVVLPQSTLNYIAANKTKDIEKSTKVGGGHH